MTFSSNFYRKVKNKRTCHTKCLDSHNKMIHDIVIETDVLHHFRISESLIRKISFFAGIFLGIIVDRLFINKIAFLKYITRDEKSILYSGKDILKLFIDFKYLFISSLILSGLIGFIFFYAAISENIGKWVSFTSTAIFFFLYSLFNMFLCILFSQFLNIKEIFLCFLIIIINFILGYVCIKIELSYISKIRFRSFSENH